MPKKKKHQIKDVQVKIFPIGGAPGNLGYLDLSQARVRAHEWIADLKELPLPSGATVFFDGSSDTRNVPVSFAVAELLGGYSVNITGTAIMVPSPIGD